VEQRGTGLQPMFLTAVQDAMKFGDCLGV
jgi:hypothetical protein